jgi:hypothetical protein
MFAQLNERHITKSKVRKRKETLKLFDKREQINEFNGAKTNFEMDLYEGLVKIKNKEDKLYAEVNYLRLISNDFLLKYEMEYKRIDFGKINLIVINEEDLKKLALPFGGITSFNFIFTSDNKNTIQHELQHGFDNVLGVSYLFKPWEKEYNAFLAGIIFSNSKEALVKMYDEINMVKWNEELWNFYEKDIHYKARLQIVSDLLDLWVDKKSSEEQIKQVALILLDRIYKKKTGMSYEEIMNEVKK